MAGTDAGAALTEEHRQAQQQVRAEFLAEFLALWVLLSSTDPLGTGPGWVRAVMELVGRFRLESAQVSVGYYRGFRAVEIPQAPPVRINDPSLLRRQRVPAADRPTPAPAASSPEPRAQPRREPTPVPDPAPRRRRDDDRVSLIIDGADALRDNTSRDDDTVSLDVTVDWERLNRAARRSLVYTGPANLDARRKARQDEQAARDTALTQASGAASRHVLNGGRETVLELVKADQKALGWARVTDSDPCAFCAMLASRGAAYKSRETAAFQPHDLCACQPVPVFTRAGAYPGRAREFLALYREATRGESGKAALRAFRRAYEQQQRDARRAGAA